MSTPRELFENTLTEKMKNNPDQAKSINAIYQFVLTGDNGGNWVVDLTQEGGHIYEGTAATSNCTVTTDAETFVKIATGKMAAPMAFMTGKLKIKGDMNLATKLGKVIG